MRFLAAIIVLIASCSSALAQSRQPADITTQPALTPQPYEILDKTGKWMSFGSSVNGVFQDLSRAISPIAFGAKCDGVTNDDTALHAWAAAFKAGTIAVVPGTCVFTNPIVFPSVTDVAITGNGTAGTLLYTGTSTTGDLITIGITNGQCLTGWTINGLRIKSNTNMTSGTGLKANMICEANISNLDVGGGIGGNENFWDGVWWHGGNSVRIRGFAFRGTNIAEVITGFSTTLPSVDIMHMQGILSHSGTGLLLGGGANGTMFDQTDILINGENVRISQERLALFNAETFLGPNVFLDVPDFARAGATGVGLHINEPLANTQFSVLHMTGTWISGARQCILIEPEARWTIKWTGGLSHICRPAVGEASIENRSTNARIELNGVRFYQPLPETKGPYIEQPASSFYGAKSLVLNDVIFEANPNGFVNGPWIGSYLGDDGKRVIWDDITGNRVITAAGNRGVSIGLDWGKAGACGIRWATAVIFPSFMDMVTPGGCPFDIGGSGAPFRFVWAGEFSSPGNVTLSAQAGSTIVKAKQGVSVTSDTGNVKISATLPTWHTLIGSGTGTNCNLWVRAGAMLPGYADGSSAPTPPCQFYVGTTTQPFYDVHSNFLYAEGQPTSGFYGTRFQPTGNAPVNFTGNGGQVNLTAPSNRIVATAGDNIQLMAETAHNVMIGTGGGKNCALWINNTRMIPGYADMTSAPTPPCAYELGSGTQKFQNVFAGTMSTYKIHSPDTTPLVVTAEGGQLQLRAPSNSIDITAGANLLLHAKETSSVVIGSGQRPGDCSLWLQTTLMAPGLGNGTTAGCPGVYFLGTREYPFTSVHARTEIKNALGVVTQAGGYAVSTPDPDGTGPGVSVDYQGITATLNPDDDCRIGVKGGIIISYNNCTP